MDWLNYHHLYYFWVVAREGSITRGSERLSLSEPTVSAQISAFEKTLGHQVFERIGHRLILTDTGKIALDYAQRIFTAGQELTDVLAGRVPSRPIRTVVGVVETVPKFIVYWLLKSLLTPPLNATLVCHEGPLEHLVAQLAVRGLDVVLSDTPHPLHAKWEFPSHVLGKSPIGLYAVGKLAARYRAKFPLNLNGAPFLLPTAPSSFRRVMDEWFLAEHIQPDIVGEFDDFAALMAFGQAGGGIFPASAIMARELTRQYRVQLLGSLAGAKLTFYALTVSPDPKHPGVLRIFESARQRMLES